jgi:outer membrane receptor for ferrienterochelin and colicin
MARFKSLLFFLISFQSLYSQTFTTSGYVEDINTGERIIGAYIIDAVSKNGVQTNNYGYYIIKNLKSNVSLQATYIGLKSEVVSFTLKHDTLINIKMKPVVELNEVVILSSAYSHNVNTPLGLITIPIKRLTSVPALGETDLLKSIQTQPGIKGGVEGSAGIFVRGGSLGENLFMLDDVPMYNVSHLYGFLSVFNSSIIKDVKLMKGCFPARYGGRTSSVLDVRSRDGNNKSITGEVSLGFISSKFAIEGPLKNDRTTFLITGRRSYFELYSGTLKKLSLLDKDFPGYYFYDLNARITHKFSQKDKIYLSIYKGRDHILNKNEETIYGNSEIVTEETNETSGWGNFVGSLRWNHTFGSSIFANTTMAYSMYDYFTTNKFNSAQKDTILNKTINKSYNANYSSSIADFIIKTDFDYSISNDQKLLFGAGSTFHTFSPGDNSYSIYDEELKGKSDTSYSNQIIHAIELYLYIEDEIRLSQKLKMNLGSRFTGFISGPKSYFNLEPRLSVNYSILPQLAFKTGYSRMVQYIHLLSTSGLTMPTDIWVPALQGLKPLKSDQINFGVSFDWNETVLISVELYRKWLNNSTDFKNGASLLTDLSPWYKKTTQGVGNAKGVEISIEKQQGKFTGSINYTLSSSDRKYADLNNGRTFPFRYQRLNDFNISVNYQISKKWDISAIWTYGTGYPVTVPVEQYSPELGLIPGLVYYYPSINNYKLPDYHRLDLGLHYKTSGRLGENSLSFDVFNAYNRKNVINMYSYGPYFRYAYLLPFIPSVTYTLKFK